jgi:hypothetical protein
MHAAVVLNASHRFTPSLAALHETHTKAAHVYADGVRDIVRNTPDTVSLTRLQVGDLSSFVLPAESHRSQCLLMLALHDCTEGRPGSGWIILGPAVRMCNLLRLARFEKPDDGILGPSGAPGGAVDAIDSENRRRTYWSAFLVRGILVHSLEVSCESSRTARSTSVRRLRAAADDAARPLLCDHSLAEV